MAIGDCGTKRITLAAIIIGIVGILVGVVWGQTVALEKRVRDNEQNIVRFEERQEAMMELLQEIRRDQKAALKP